MTRLAAALALIFAAYASAPAWMPVSAAVGECLHEANGRLP